MRKLLLTLFLGLALIGSSFAQEKAKVFPEQNLAPFLGLDDTSSPPQVKDFRASDLLNITLDNTGQASKRYGFSLRNTILDINADDNFEAVTGLYELYKSSGTKYFIAICGTRAWWDNSGTWTNITGDAAITAGQDKQFVWATALDYAIGTNFVNPPIQWNGSGNFAAVSFTGLSNAITSAKCVIWWKNYLIFGNTVENSVSRTTRIRWSNVGTITTWSDNDYVDIATLGGQQIEAMATLYDDLYIFLTDSIYKVSLVGGDELINVTKVSEGIGCIAKNSVKNIGIGNSEGLIFLSRDKTINYLDGVKVTELSSLIDTTMDGLLANRLQYAVAVDDRVNAHYYLAVTNGAVAYNNLVLDFHYGIGEWSKHNHIWANAFGFGDDSNTVRQVYFGNHKAMVYLLNNPNLYSDVGGKVGTLTSVATRNTQTASGLQVLYDSSATFDTLNVTGAVVRITSGTGSSQEAVICARFTTGIVVTNAFTTTPNSTSAYSIGDINAYYTTKWYDLGSAPLRKNFGELFVWSTTDTAATMQVYYATDFINTITSTDIVTEVSGSLWGTATFGSGTWAGTSTSLTRVALNVTGRFIKLEFSEPTIDEPMDLMGYTIVFWPLDIF